MYIFLHSGVSLTYPKKCHELNVGNFLLIKGKPVQITNISTSKTGKHGSSKVSCYYFQKKKVFLFKKWPQCYIVWFKIVDLATYFF